jgi:hypothetical protein
LFDRRPAEALAQLALVAQSGLGGDALFSDDAIAESPALLAALTNPSPLPASVDAEPAAEPAEEEAAIPTRPADAIDPEATADEVRWHE